MATLMMVVVPGMGAGEERLSSPLLSHLAPQQAEAFWAQIGPQGSPLIEPSPEPDTFLVSFLWRGADTGEVELSWPVWTPDRKENRLTRIEGTDIWVKTVSLPRGTRLSYQLAIDPVRGAEGDRDAYRAGLMAAVRPDPRNPLRMGKLSVLEVPDAPPQPYVAKRPGIAEGRVWAENIHNPLNNLDYEITFYRPSGVATDQPTPLVILFDAERYLDTIPTPVILDNMIADGVIPPVSAVLIRNPSRQSRGEDLACNPDFSEAMANGLMPWIYERIRVSARAEDVVVAGSSYGGLMSVCTVMAYPEVFGKALSQSGSFWWDPAGVSGKAADDHHVINLVRAGPRPDVRIYLDAGVLEQRAGQDNRDSIYVTTEALYQAMKVRGYDVSFHPVAGGHDDATWRGSLSDGLIDLLGGK